MRQCVIYCHDAAGAWTEKYVEGERGSFKIGEADIEGWARRLVQRFNDTLRTGERERTMDRVEVAPLDDPNYRPDHAWSKTNAITLSDRLGTYDTMRCDMCGVTAKRFGVDRIKIDSRWKAKKYQRCGWQREGSEP